jgi:hypothetical protein
MDHQYIEEHNVVDRYVMGRLAAGEELEFEEHFMDCSECLRQIELAENFQQALKSVAADEAARSSGSYGVGIVSWLAHLNPLRQSAILAVALILVLGLPAYLYFQVRQLRAEVNQQQTASREWQKRYEEQVKATQTPGERLPPSSQRESVAQQGQEPVPNELVRLIRPQANTAIYDLSDERAPAPTNEIVLSPTPQWGVFSLNLVSGREYESYRVTIESQGGRLLWDEGGLHPNRYDALTIGFTSAFFQPGDYVLRLYGVSSSGEPVSIANYPIRVVKK